MTLINQLEKDYFFVNAIKQVAAPNESELREIKQIVIEQHETVNAIANVLKQGLNRPKKWSQNKTNYPTVSESF